MPEEKKIDEKEDVNQAASRIVKQIGDKPAPEDDSSSKPD